MINSKRKQNLKYLIPLGNHKLYILYSTYLCNVKDMTTMIMDAEMAREVLSAIEIAHGVCDGFEELQAKILGAFPEIVEENRLREIKIQEICNEQKRGKQLVVAKFSKDVPHPTVSEAMRWYLENEKFIRSNYSDEICFAGEMWESLPKPQLNEMIVSLRATKGRNSLENDGFRNRKDSDLWHCLIPFLENATYLERVRKSKKN